MTFETWVLERLKKTWIYWSQRNISREQSQRKLIYTVNSLLRGAAKIGPAGLNNDFMAIEHELKICSLLSLSKSQRSVDISVS